MFYILMILGIASIALGIFLEKGKAIVKEGDRFIEEIYNSELKEDQAMAREERDKTALLEERINLLEEKLFQQTLEEATKAPIVVEEEEEEDALDQYKLIRQYEKEKKSLDEIAKLLNMNKGEVLLLKSLYKNL